MVDTDTILNETPVSMAELKEELEKIKKRDKELNFRANRTEEYLQHLDIPKNSKELYGALDKLKIPRLKDLYIKKLIDLMPTSVEEVKVIMQGYAVTISAENVKKIVDVINKFKEEK